MTEKELYNLISCDESYRIERTVSTSNMDKFQEAICAFANDLPGKRKKGYLLIGVTDDGQIGGLTVDDALMKRISGIRSDGNILPLPVMNTEKVYTKDGDVLVVEVTPSFDTPVRYRGRTFVRIGPRRDIASAEEERILSERCAASLPTFDTYPCRDAKMDDIDLDTILREYLPKAIAPDVLQNDHRSVEEQLASLHLYNSQWNCPTYAAVIMFGKRPRFFMPGAYIQYVHFKGSDNGGKILNERRFEGGLYHILPQLENFIRDGIITKRPIPISILREKDVQNYPFKALRELMMNAVMHRDYQSNMPTRLYQYDHHIEIMNPGGLYGQARPENFPHVNDYRNGVVAEMMRTLNYVNMFNHGIGEVQDQLRENENPPAEFNVSYLTAFSVVVKMSEEQDSTIRIPNNGKVKHSEYEAFITKLYQTCPNIGKVQEKVGQTMVSLFLLCEEAVSVKEMMETSGIRSRMTFDRDVLKPLLTDTIIAPTFPNNLRHPRQKYTLTDKGRELLSLLQNGEDQNK